jgi:hypothetical protein
LGWEWDWASDSVSVTDWASVMDLDLVSVMGQASAMDLVSVTDLDLLLAMGQATATGSD